MKLENLKTGMVLEFEDNRYAMVLLNTDNGNIFSGRGDWGLISELDFENDCTIVRVWQPLTNMNYFLDRYKDNKYYLDGGWELVWEKPKVKEMTIKEIERELGYKVKIVD